MKPLSINILCLVSPLHVVKVNFRTTIIYCIKFLDDVMIHRQESYFAYLFGVREPSFYGAIVSF